MSFDHRRTVTHRLAQAAHAYRVRAGGQLARIGLHSGQENLLKALAAEDGMSMSDLAATRAVGPDSGQPKTALAGGEDAPAAPDRSSDDTTVSLVLSASG